MSPDNTWLYVVLGTIVAVVLAYVAAKVLVAIVVIWVKHRLLQIAVEIVLKVLERYFPRLKRWREEQERLHPPVPARERSKGGSLMKRGTRTIAAFAAIAMIGGLALLGLARIGLGYLPLYVSTFVVAAFVSGILPRQTAQRIAALTVVVIVAIGASLLAAGLDRLVVRGGLWPLYAMVLGLGMAWLYDSLPEEDEATPPPARPRARGNNGGNPPPYVPQPAPDWFDTPMTPQQGTSMPRVCPRGHVAPNGGRFCGRCGEEIVTL